MSNQYQSKPALTDALAGKLKKGDSSRGLIIIDDTNKSKKHDNETSIKINHYTQQNRNGYELIDVNTDNCDEKSKPDMCMSFTFCICIVSIFGFASYGALLLFEDMNNDDNMGNGTSTNITNITNFTLDTIL
tara:strand:- start:456 stop:851 length:396 start_codon:yes stop_codon:yes gene_type:complete